MVPGQKKGVSWSSFYRFGEGNVLVSTGREAIIGHPQRRHTRPGPLPGTQEPESSRGLLGNVTAKKYIYICIYIYKPSKGGQEQGWGWIRGSGGASHSRSCLPETPLGWCPSVTQSRSCPLAAGCPRSSEGSPWTS